MKSVYRILLVTAAGCLLVGQLRAVDAGNDVPETGKIYLVRMGPGDLDLATVRALRVVERADKVVCSGHVTETLVLSVKEEALEPIQGFLSKRYYVAVHSKLPGEASAKEKEARKQFAGFIAKVRRFVAEGRTVAIADSDCLQRGASRRRADHSRDPRDDCGRTRGWTTSVPSPGLRGRYSHAEPQGQIRLLPTNAYSNRSDRKEEIS